MIQQLRILICDALVYFAVAAVGHSDKQSFNQELSLAFEHPMDDRIASRLHLAYRCVMAGFPDAFQSGNKLRNRRRVPKKKLNAQSEVVKENALDTADTDTDKTVEDVGEEKTVTEASCFQFISMDEFHFANSPPWDYRVSTHIEWNLGPKLLTCGRTHTSKTIAANGIDFVATLSPASASCKRGCSSFKSSSGLAVITFKCNTAGAASFVLTVRLHGQLAQVTHDFSHEYRCKIRKVFDLANVSAESSNRMLLEIRMHSTRATTYYTTLTV